MHLYTPSEIDRFQQDLPYLLQITEWAKNFLTSPHPDLGRGGKVCPYMPSALKSDAVKLVVIRDRVTSEESIEEIVKNYLSIFLETEPKTGISAIYKAFMLIFADVNVNNSPHIIDRVQQKLKPIFVEAGLMIGEFHQRNETPGLHNANFRPLKSPISMLAIRFMVESDLPFLQHPTIDPHLRIKYIDAYLKYFSNKFKDENNLKQALEAKVLAQQEIFVNQY